MWRGNQQTANIATKIGTVLATFSHKNHRIKLYCLNQETWREHDWLTSPHPLLAVMPLSWKMKLKVPLTPSLPDFIRAVEKVYSSSYLSVIMAFGDPRPPCYFGLLTCNPSPVYYTPATSQTHSPVFTGWKPRACSVQAGDHRLSFMERYGSSLPGCRSAPFVWYAVQTTSEIVTHWPARCPPVAVLNCWSPIVCCGWCSTWNSLPHNTVACDTLLRFRRERTTSLFRQSFCLNFSSCFVLVSCARLSWLHSAFESTLNSAIVSYRILCSWSLRFLLRPC